MEKNLKKTRENGITLIALVITIVILIILASVTISNAFGESGLIEKTKQAQKMTEEAIKNEKEQLNYLLDNFSNIMEDADSNMEYVAQIGNIKYTTLSNAIDAVPNGEKTIINIIKDFDQEVTAQIPEEKDIVIDLQNHCITLTTGSILNKGNLEIKSNNELDVGKIIIQNNEYAGINNNGDLKISSGTYESTGTNNAVANYGTGTVTISGGKIIGSKIESEKYPAIWNDASGTIMIEGGTLEATASALIYNNSDGKVLVNGGNLKSKKDNVIDNNSNGNIIITNGFMQATEATTVINSSNGVIEIKGGEIAGSTSEENAWPTVRNYADGEIIIDGGLITGTVERAIYNGKDGNIVIKDGIMQSTSLNTIGNYGTGTITILGGEIRGIESAEISYPTVWNNSNGNIIMNGGIIDATVGNGISTAINNAGSGNIIVTGGIVKSTNYAINNGGTGSITLGVDDQNISTTTPEIISSNNSQTIVGKRGTTLNFFDGIIKGGGIQSILTIVVPEGRTYYKNDSKPLYETTLQ